MLILSWKFWIWTGRYLTALFDCSIPVDLRKWCPHTGAELYQLTGNQGALCLSTLRYGHHRHHNWKLWTVITGLLTTCRYLRKINRKTNVRLLNHMLAMASRLHNPSYKCRQVYGCLHFQFSREIGFVWIWNSKPRPVLNLCKAVSLDWLTLSRYIVYYRAPAAVIWLKHILGSN